MTYGAAAALSMPVAGKAVALATAYQEAGAPKSAGRISEKITYAGNGVHVPSFPVIKDNHICGEGERKPKSLRVGDNGEFGDCGVQIKGIRASKLWDPAFYKGKIYQIDCRFQPYFQILRSQALVDVHNLDCILYNIHAYEVYKGTRRSMFNFAQPNQGQVDRIPMKLRRGNLLTIDCNANNWMAAWVYTSPTPYLSVTSLDGRFEISDIPPGNYEFSVWHPMLGEKPLN